MTINKEKLVKRLLEGDDNIFTEFVIVGLENSLELIAVEIERLLKVKNLKDNQWEDLTELTHDGRAIVRVLRYYTTTRAYNAETDLLNKAIDRWKEWI